MSTKRKIKSSDALHCRAVVESFQFFSQMSELSRKTVSKLLTDCSKWLLTSPSCDLDL